jgi:hypothetical protein
MPGNDTALGLVAATTDSILKQPTLLRAIQTSMQT